MFVPAATSLALLVALSPATASGAHAQRSASPTGCADASVRPGLGSTQTSGRSVLCLLNAERAKRGLRKLRSSRSLETAARRHSTDMVERNYFDHQRRGGPDLVKRVRRTGYLKGARSWAVGENIAWGTGDLATPQALVRAWMESQGHRENILDPDFREVGVAVVLGAPSSSWGDEDEAATATTDFGKRS